MQFKVDMFNMNGTWTSKSFLWSAQSNVGYDQGCWSVLGGMRSHFGAPGLLDVRKGAMVMVVVGGWSRDLLGGTGRRGPWGVGGVGCVDRAASSCSASALLMFGGGGTVPSFLE